MTTLEAEHRQDCKDFVRSTDQLLQERGKTHGDFRVHAAITQQLKFVVRTTRHRQMTLTESQQEAIDMILHKIGRIIAGNPNHQDHWDDIAGYARLISQQLSNPGG